MIIGSFCQMQLHVSTFRAQGNIIHVAFDPLQFVHYTIVCEGVRDSFGTYSWDDIVPNYDNSWE